MQELDLIDMMHVNTRLLLLSALVL